MFSDISGLCARDAGSTPPPGVTARRVSRHRQMNMPGRQDVPGLRVTALDPLIREAQSVMAQRGPGSGGRVSVASGQGWTGRTEPRG